MARSDPTLRNGRAARRTRTIDVLALAPLPFRSGGAATFQSGVAIFYAELLPRLAAAGHPVRVLAEAPPLRAGERRHPLPWRLPNLSVEWFAFGYRSGTRPPTRSYHRALARDLRPRFERAIRVRRPDVVLVGREILTPYVETLCRTHGLPCVVVAHGVAIAAMLERSYPAAARRRMTAALRRAARVVAVAKHLEDDLRRLGVTRVQTSPTVVDPRTFHPRAKSARLLRQLGIAPDDAVVGHFSTLEPVKRPLDIVTSAALVLRSYPACRYLIAGAGRCRAAMERLARRRGIAGRLHFIGEIDHARVPRYMNLCDLVVMPSQRESFPLAYREAQASGCVVVASDIPAAREAIVPHRTGVLFRRGDARALAAATLRLLRDRPRRQRLAAAARAAVAAHPPRRWCRQYADLLRDVVSSDRPGPPGRVPAQRSAQGGAAPPTNAHRRRTSSR
jgi:glycosyltransferase involved in cell wall biosynthesis